MNLKFDLRKAVILAIREITDRINASGLTTNVASISVFAAVTGDLARILISAERLGEYTEEQKERARRRISR
jgi:hypothetical protein